MIVDTSALVAILQDEPEGDMFARILAISADNRMSAGSWIELAAVDTRRFGGTLRDGATRLLSKFRIAIEPVTAAQAEIGQAAYRRYGIGSGHPAKLSFGDCFAYALSREMGEPLLFKGDDFPLTDVVAAG